jgi:hypothetical protein
MMNKEYFIRLTLALYRVTELLSEKEPLRMKIREKAGEVLADLILASKSNPGLDRDPAFKIQKNLDILDAFFDLALSQNWIDSRNFLVLREEYGKIRENLKNKNPIQKRALLSPAKQQSPGFELSFRQKKILEILRKEKSQIRDLQKFFPGVSKRTLRRDLEDLIEKKQVKRRGQWNLVFYQLEESGNRTDNEKSIVIGS